MVTIDYDDRNLQKLFAEMEPKHRLKALKGAFRREANRLRKAAVKNLRGSLQSNKELESGVRRIVFKKKAGFRITIGTKKANRKGKGERGYYISRSRRKNLTATGKPVLIWAEAGTASRRTKGRFGLFKRPQKAHSTGTMKRYGFMRKMHDAESGKVTNNIHNEVVKSIIKTSEKYGCK